MTIRLVRNQTLGQALLRLAPGQAQAILAGRLADMFPFERARPGDQIRLERVEGDRALRRLSYRQSAADEWMVTAGEDGALRGEKRAVELVTEQARVDVENRGARSGRASRGRARTRSWPLSPSDALAWDVDFYQDVRAGDHLKVVVEKLLVDGKLLRYGEVLAAEYDGAVTGPRRLFRYQDPTGSRATTTTPATAPAAASSSPPSSTPTSPRVRQPPPPPARIRALAPGRRLRRAGRDARVGGGRRHGHAGRIQRRLWQSVTLRHRNGFETVYCHLSAISVHLGARVMQKDLVGQVGQTGLATGPHLHFAVRHAGTFVNPLRLKVPREAPIAPEHRADFEEKVAPLRARLEERGLQEGA